MENRYTCNFPALSEAESEILAKKRVCVIGCGGLGGHILEMLARIGVGTLTAADPDSFCESNLNRQLFAATETIGLPKVQSAKKRLHAVNPSISFRALPVSFCEETAAEILRGHDVAVDALDNIPSRLLLADYCRNFSIPLVHGAAEGWCGQVSTILPGDDTLSLIYQSGTASGPNPGTLAFAAAATASFQCAEVIKLLIGRGKLLSGRLLWIDLLHGDCSELHLG